MSNCPKRDKNCRQVMCFDYKTHYICSGKNRKPTKYKNDTINLCLKGKHVDNFGIEMTESEALLIISALTGCLSEGAQK